METGFPADVCIARGVFSLPNDRGQLGLNYPRHDQTITLAGRLCLRAHLLSLVNGDDSGAMEGMGGGDFLSPPQDAVCTQRKNDSGALKLES